MNYESNALMNDYPKATAEAVRVSEVAQSTDRLVNSLEVLDKSVHELEGRLSAVLAERVVNEAKASKPEPLRVPLAGVLHMRADSVDSIRDRVQSILSRLEL